MDEGINKLLASKEFEFFFEQAIVPEIEQCRGIRNANKKKIPRKSKKEVIIFCICIGLMIILYISTNTPIFVVLSILTAMMLLDSREDLEKKRQIKKYTQETCKAIS